MDKNWLIRTKSNHILGPVSKEKVQELYKNGSIKADDEICSGNGFWFFVREDDMVSRFLLGEEIQGFNPISEAKDVLTLSNATPVPSLEEVAIAKDELTLVGGISLSMLADAPTHQEEQLPDTPPVEVTDTTPPPAPHPEEVPEIKKKSKPERVGKTAISHSSKARHPAPAPKKQNYLKWVGLLGFLVLFGLIYFRKTIIKSLFNGEVSGTSFTIIEEVQAQEVLLQKKNF